MNSALPRLYDNDIDTNVGDVLKWFKTNNSDKHRKNKEGMLSIRLER